MMSASSPIRGSRPRGWVPQCHDAVATAPLREDHYREAAFQIYFIVHSLTGWTLTGLLTAPTGIIKERLTEPPGTWRKKPCLSLPAVRRRPENACSFASATNGLEKPQGRRRGPAPHFLRTGGYRAARLLLRLTLFPQS